MEEPKNLKQKTQSKSKGTKALISMLLLTTITSLCIVMYAWARYSTIDNGSASANVAKWHFELKEGTVEGTKQYLALTRTDSYGYVAEGKVAPGTYGEIPIVIDSTGTQVDMAYDLEVRIQNCPLNMTFKNSANEDITPIRTGTGAAGSPRVAVIKISKYVPYTVTDANRVHDETISWNWEYRTGTTESDKLTNDAIDTNDAGKEITVQVTVTGIEVTGKPVTTGTVNSTNLSGTPVAVSNGTINLATGKTTTLSITNGGSGTSTVEGVTYSSSNTAVATVNSTTGVVTPVSAGTATITMTGNETGKTVSVTVNVKDAITNATVKKDGTALNLSNTIELTEEDTAVLTVELAGSSNLEPFTYVSSDTDVVTVDSSGNVVAVGEGTATITITGSYSGETKTISVEVAAKPQVQAGQLVRYVPTGSYTWDKKYATANSTDTIALSATGNCAIIDWKVLSIEGDIVNLVPANGPTSATVTFQGAQGYNNVVQLLNTACSELYKNTTKGITARSVKIEDFEAAPAVVTARNSYSNGSYTYGGTQAYTNKRRPTLYANELNGTYSLSQPTTGLIERDGSSKIGAVSGQIFTATQTYYSLSYSDLNTKLGDLSSKLLPNGSSTNYWVASRCVNLYSSYCSFYVRFVNSGGLSAYFVFSTYGDEYEPSARGLFPVVSLSTSLLKSVTGQTYAYEVK